MSDPRKNFVCPKCGYVINDKYREWGNDTPCPRCEMEKFMKDIREKKEG